MAKSDKIVSLAHEKHDRRQEEILTEIEKMRRRRKPINFSSVQKATGASRSYLYQNKTIRAEIERARSSSCQDLPVTKDAKIKLLTDRIKVLEKENAQLREDNSETYKQRCKDLTKENKELKNQLKVAYEKYC